MDKIVHTYLTLSLLPIKKKVYFIFILRNLPHKLRFFFYSWIPLFFSLLFWSRNGLKIGITKI